MKYYLNRHFAKKKRIDATFGFTFDLRFSIPLNVDEPFRCSTPGCQRNKTTMALCVITCHPPSHLSLSLSLSLSVSFSLSHLSHSRSLSVSFSLSHLSLSLSLSVSFSLSLSVRLTHTHYSARKQSLSHIRSKLLSHF